MRAANRSLRGMNHHFGAVLVAQYRGVFEDGGACRLRGARHTQSVFQRIQMAAARVDQPAEIQVAAHMGLQHRFQRTAVEVLLDQQCRQIEDAQAAQRDLDQW